MGIEGRENRKEPIEPAKKETVEAVASGLKDLLGKSNVKNFPIGEDSGKMLEVVKLPVAPWGQHKDGTRIGSNLFATVKEEETIFKGDNLETKTKVTPFRVDTSITKSPKLHIAAHETDEYLADERGKYWDRSAERSSLPQKERWKPSPEDKAQELQTIVDGLVTEAKEGKPSKLELQEKFETEFDRIIAKTGGALVDVDFGKAITFPLEDKAVKLIYYEKGDAKSVNILYPQTEQRVVTENYFVYGGMPMESSTSSRTLEEEQETPMLEAGRKEIIALSNTLKRLSDEVIYKELATREVIRSKAESILAQKGSQEDMFGTVEVQLENAAASVQKIVGEKGTGIVVLVDHLTHVESKSEGDVVYQRFSLSPGNPLEVKTFYQSTLPTSTLATEQEKEYVLALLEDLDN